MSHNTRSNDTVRYLTKASVFAALIFLATAYLSVPLPLMGYVHLGDGFILLAAALLPTPYAVAAAVVGAGLADFMAGFAVYIPATVAIKALTAILVSNKTKKLIGTRNLLALIPAALICACGYYLYEALIYKSFVAPLASVPLNIAQSLCGALVFIVLGLLIDKNRGLAKIFKENK